MDNMNEIYSYHKELNIKKIIFLIILIIVLLISSSIIIYKLLIMEPEETPQEEFSTFYDSNNSISITLSKKYNLVSVDSDDYLLKLKSTKNLGIFISNNELLNKTIEEVANADLKTYIQSFSETSDVSNLEEFKINDNLGYTYSFHYLDSQTETVFYLQVIWININNEFYTFDFEFPLDDLNDYTDIINETLDNFKIINN